MTDVAALAQIDLFGGISVGDLQPLARAARERGFAAGEELCRAGERSERCWAITGGLVEIQSAAEAGEGSARLRRRRGSVVGEAAALLGVPYAETVVASMPTTTLEFDRGELQQLAERDPRLLRNALRAQHETLAVARERAAERSRGETVAVAVGPSLGDCVGPLIAAARASTPRSVTSLDRRFSFAGALTAADSLASEHGTILLPSALDAETVSALLREADRVVALAGSAAEAAALGGVGRERERDASVDVVLVGEEAVEGSRGWPVSAPLRVVRTCPRDQHGSLSARDRGWVARHLTQTKLGLALGAGGAKGYAHVGALAVLEEAGYVVDAVAGSSIGAIVGTLVAIGQDATAIGQRLRAAFDPPAVAEIFKPSLSGRASGVELMARLLREATGERTFADALIPLTVMAVDLSERAPAPLRDGPLWEALMAATALAGVFPPHERDGHRLVDGLALVPVPAGEPLRGDADVIVSVNLISAQTLERWPGAPPPEPPPERRRRGILDNLLEVMDLSQLADSVHSAGLADVVITPRFGPGEWRDFHLADQYLQAGRDAATEELPRLASAALPATGDNTTALQGGGIERADAVRV
jgi:NTE family protein